MLALLLSASVFVSCAADISEETDALPSMLSEESIDQAAEETDSTLAEDDLGEADFDGAEYIIAGLSNRTSTAVTASEINGEVINDAQYNSARAVEERFDVKISYEDIADSDENMHTAVKNIIAGGEDKYAVTFGVDTKQITLALTGNYYNLKAIPQFNFDKPWWIDSTDTIGIGDRAYVASSYLSYYCLYYMRLLVVNKDMAADLGIEVPYDKVFEGTWYLDDLTALCEIATGDTDGDGQMTDGDRYGISYEVLYTFQSSLGIKLIDKDENNMPFVSLDLDRSSKYLEKAENLFDNYGYKESNYGANFFANNKSLFCYCNLREVCSIIRDTDINYGYLPAPKLDELQEDYISCATDVYWGIPVTNIAKLDMIGTITEALSCQHFNYVRPAFYETTMKTKLSGNENDVKVLDLIAEKLCIDFSFAYQGSISTATLDDMYVDGVTSQSIASAFKSSQKVLTKGLEKLLANVEELPES